MLREAYLLAAINLKRTKQLIKRTKDPVKIKVRDPVLSRNHKKETWDTNICLTSIFTKLLMTGHMTIWTLLVILDAFLARHPVTDACG